MPVHNVVYRTARVADIPALTALLAQLFAIESDFQSDPDKQARGLHLLIEQSQTHPKSTACIVVAQINEKVIGMCTVQVLILSLIHISEPTRPY